MTASTQAPILVMAGGTGGHVFPALAVAEDLRQRGEQVVWLGTRNSIEARVVPEAGFKIEWLSVQGLRGKGWKTLVMAPFRLLRACWQSQRLLSRIQPKAVLGMGGFVSGPGGLMAWMMNIPLFLHEQNSVIGLTNRLLSRFARKNYFAFPDVAAKVARSECIGNPVRKSLTEIAAPEQRLKSRMESPMQLLVIGGSLGAASLNRVLPEALACIDRVQRPLVRHQCGEKHLQHCLQQYKDHTVEAEVVSFIDDMEAAYQWADLIVCRAGALTISELAAVGLASILIPFPYAVDNHQYHNALYLSDADAAQLIIESELNAEKLALKLRYFQQNREILVNMAANARRLGRADATEKLASGILTGIAL